MEYRVLIVKVVRQEGVAPWKKKKKKGSDLNLNLNLNLNLQLVLVLGHVLYNTCTCTYLPLT